MNKFYRIYKRITYCVLKFSLILFFISVVFFTFFMILDDINLRYNEGYFKPYRQIYCLDNNEYLLTGISQEEFMLKLDSLIKTDPSACYAKNKRGEIDTMTINSKLLGVNHALNQGPLCYTVTFFVPFDNDKLYSIPKLFNDFTTNDDYFKYYPDKYKYSVSIVDTEPLRLLLPRGVGFGNAIGEVNQYFRETYLDKICEYDRQYLKNFLMESINWSIVAIYYSFSLLAIAVIWIIVWLIYNLFRKVYHIIIDNEESECEKNGGK